MRYTAPKITRIMHAASTIKSAKGAPFSDILGGIMSGPSAYQSDE